MYCGYGITFDGAGSWNFDNDFARNVVSFGVDNNSSSHTDNRKTNLLLLGEDPTYHINGSFGSPEKNVSIEFSKSSAKFSLSLHYNGDIVMCLLLEKKSFCNFRADKEMLTFLLSYVLEAYLMHLVLLNLERYL